MCYPEISLILSSQLAYEAWVAGSKAALKTHKREEVQLMKEEKRELCNELSTVTSTHFHIRFLYVSYFIICLSPPGQSDLIL